MEVPRRDDCPGAEDRVTIQTAQDVKWVLLDNDNYRAGVALIPVAPAEWKTPRPDTFAEAGHDPRYPLRHEQLLPGIVKNGCGLLYMDNRRPCRYTAAQKERSHEPCRGWARSAAFSGMKIPFAAW